MADNTRLKQVWNKHAERAVLRNASLAELKGSDDIIIQTLFKQPKNKKVLDAGCGIGQYVAVSRILGFQAQGIDISEKAVQIARKKGEKVILGDIRKMPFKSKSFDIVIAGGSIEHFPETSQALKEISRVMKKSGIFLGNVPYKYALFYSISRKIQQILGMWKAGYEKTFSRIFLDNNLGPELIKVTPIARGNRKILSSLLRILDAPLYFLGFGGGHFYFIARKK